MIRQQNFFIRLSRGSGLNGLVSFSKKKTLRDEVNIVRPLLSFEKKHLELIIDIIKNTYTDFKIDSKINSIII